MVSNGAYVLKEWVPNSHIRLQKNPQFHAAASVKIDVVRYEPTKDLSAAARRFMAGELQSTSDIPADQTKFLKEKLGDQVKISPYLGTWYLAVNTSKKPFDDVRVRQALSIAIDREFIAEEIWQGTMLPAYSFVPPGTGNYGKPATADYKDLSPIDREDKAKALLKEAGFGPGKPLKVELRYNTTDNNQNTAVAIANQWKAIGVETSFINTDAKTHFAYLRDGGDFDVARAGWIADYSDPQNFLFLRPARQPGLQLRASTRTRTTTRLMRKSGEEKDLDKRAAILLEAETMFMRDLPYIPILFYSNKNLSRSKLEGWVPNLRGANATRFLSLKP